MAQEALPARLIEGALDVHVHATPSLFPRWGTGEDVAGAVRAARMHGFVLKAHHGSSVEHAAALRTRFPELWIAGGITLNHFVGGLNPHAVVAAVALGARMVWLPTLHAEGHLRAFGTTGGFDFVRPEAALPEAPALRITTPDGELRPEVRKIVRGLDRSGVVLATGHVSEPEIRALIGWVERESIRVHVLVNHAAFRVPALSATKIGEMTRPWVFFELCAFTTTALGGGGSARAAALMDDVPDANWILASDSGQADNPSPPAMLAAFAAELADLGCVFHRLRECMRSNPLRLFDSPERG